MTAAFALVAVAVLRLAPIGRRKVQRSAFLFALAVAAVVVTGVSATIWPETGEVHRFMWYLHQIAIALAGIGLILVTATLVFDVLLPRLNVHLPSILEDVLVVAALVVFGLIRLGMNGVDATSLFTTSALITAVIALSLQDTLGNLLGGLALQADQSIKVGDWVQIESTAGCVVEIGWRQTSIETNNWETIVVPNSVLVKNRFLVLGRRTGQPIQHRRWVPFYVDSSVSPDEVIGSVEAALRAMEIECVAKRPAPQCFLLDLAENPVRYAVSYWLTNLQAMNPTDSSVRVQSYLALKRSGIQIAIPARNVLMTEETSERRELRWEQEVAQRVVALRTIDLFRVLTADELNTLAERLQPAPYLKGDILVRQGATGERLYIIVEGRGDVLVENEAEERAKVAELGPGDFFGEMALMTGEPRTATVVAKTNMLTYRLDRRAFRDMLAARPDVAEEISTILAQRREELEERREHLDAETTAARAAATRRDIRARIWHFFGLDN
jgi:small-conductance mechanosensitive channel/CRP-like cAMP-binding protein